MLEKLITKFEGGVAFALTESCKDEAPATHDIELLATEPQALSLYKVTPVPDKVQLIGKAVALLVRTLLFLRSKLIWAQELMFVSWI